MRYTRLLPLLFCVLTSCVVGPNYQEPQVEIDGRWASEREEVSSALPIAKWWESFQDELLSEYIVKSAYWNYDILIAESNICYARAVRSIVSSKYYPQVDFEVDYLRSHLGKNAISLGLFQLQDQPNFSSIFDTELFSLGFDALWEVDLFGKIRRQVEGATANLGSAIETRNDVMITVFGDVAKNYIAVRGAQSMVELLERQIEQFSLKLKIAEERVKTGLVSEIEATDVKAQLETLKMMLPMRKTEEYAAIYRLGVLTGQMPECVLEDLKAFKPLPFPPEEIAVGVRSTLLKRRPDIREAEREFAAAVADVGVAVAEYFPDVRLRGNLFQRSVKFEDLFEGNSFSWMLGGNALTPIFHGGALKANLIANDALAKAALQNYMKTILLAVEEAETALAAYLNQKKSYDSAEKALLASAQTLLMTEEQYQFGLISHSELIDVFLEHFEIETNCVQSRIDLLYTSVALYKALAGGCE